MQTMIVVDTKIIEIINALSFQKLWTSKEYKTIIANNKFQLFLGSILVEILTEHHAFIHRIK